jgi:hypothetical protein
MPRHTIENYNRTKQFISTKFGNICCHCGSKENLEFHIIGNGSGKALGGWQHLELIIELLITKGRAIELVCSNCHHEQHKKEGIY